MSSKPKQANWKTSTLDGRSNLENLQRILLEAKGAIKADAIKQTEYFRNLDITAQQISNKLNQPICVNGRSKISNKMPSFTTIPPPLPVPQQIKKVKVNPPSISKNHH
jgi:hypothetical protein